MIVYPISKPTSITHKSPQQRYSLAQSCLLLEFTVLAQAVLHNIVFVETWIFESPH